jgi:hypothetical protein
MPLSSSSHPASSSLNAKHPAQPIALGTITDTLSRTFDEFNTNMQDTVNTLKPSSKPPSTALLYHQQTPGLTLILPSQPTLSSAGDTPTTTYTYRAQLTFQLKKTPHINVAGIFGEWLSSSLSMLPNFSLASNENPTENFITSTDQLPKDNQAFYTQYFHNHHVLSHGNLASMVAFQCTIPWSSIKSPTSQYFQLLKAHRVFMNPTKFKIDNLVPCGFLFGALPSYLRRDEAEQELQACLHITPKSLPFHLSSRPVSAPTPNNPSVRYHIQANKQS